jgi:Ni/Co efflux regulator RcnB
MKKLLLTVVALTACSAALAQVGTTVMEGAKATSQKAQQLGDQAKASVESQPDKAIDKTKAQVHKAKAKHHAKKAKDAGENITK